jgi:Transposase DDE domain
MLNEVTTQTLYQVFIDADDFMLAYNQHLQRQVSKDQKQKSGPKRSLSQSEVITILIFYQHSGYKCFQYYYESMVLKELGSYFPGLVSYSHFLGLIKDVAVPLFLFNQCLCTRSAKTGVYFVDSKKLAVCDNRRIRSNRVFKGVAGQGKSSTGWFYGLKMHLVINNLGEIMHFLITPANFADNNKQVMDELFFDLKGKCFGDKGYLTKFFDYFLDRGIQIITKIRRNMKNTLMQLHDKYWLRKRAVIESVNDILMTVFDVDHTRHRNPWNAIIHALAGIAAYAYYPEKPSVFIRQEIR